MTSPLSPSEAVEPDERRWIALAVVLAAAFMDLVDVTIVNIAIPTINRTMDTSIGQIQWVTAGYALAFAVGLITGGRLGDIYGRRRLFLLGVGAFTLASVACGVAGNAEVLVAARILQGASAALMVPQVLSIVHSTFPPQERGKVFGMYGAIVGLGGICGPLLGALLTEWNLFGLEWRLIFLINVPVGIIALVLGLRYIAESKAPFALRLDLVGVALVTVAMLMLVYPLTRGRELGWPLWGYLSMAGSLAVFAALVAYEKHKTRKDGSPLVELSLFKAPSFSAGIAVQLAFGVVTGIFFLVWTLYLQVGLGWSVIRAGLTGLPFSIATSMAAGISVQALVPRFGRKVLQAGALIMASGMLIYLWEADRYGTGIASWQMILPLLVIGAGMGLIVAPLTDAILSGVPPKDAGSASGLISTTLQMGNALGLALTSVFFFSLVDGALSPRTLGTSYSDAFENSLWWVAGLLGAIALLIFALPAKARPEFPGMEAQVAEPVPAGAVERPVVG